MKASVAHCKAFLLDWDGTLIDSLSIKIANAAELFVQLFGADREAVLVSYGRHSGVPRRELFDLIAADCIGRTITDIEFEEASGKFTELNRERIADQAQLRPGTLEVLSQLKTKDSLVFISTATAQDEIDPLAAEFGVAEFCTEIMGSRPGFTKGPVHAAHVTSRYGVGKHELAGVGDDVEDMRLFREAGIAAVGITGTRSRSELIEAGADLVIDRLEEIASRVV